MSGVCSGGGDASRAVGVTCGGITCAVDQQCCLDFVLTLHCTALGISCDGIAVTCDGTEDCGGNACCEGIGLSIGCAGTAICPNPGQGQICRDASDCTGPVARQCCFDDGLPGEPWGRCAPFC